MIYTFPYCGNKFNFLQEIIKHAFIAKDLGCIKMIEPFGGSGVISLNMHKIFDNVIYNEIDKNITRIHNAFKYGAFEQYNSFHKLYNIDSIDLTNKETYYNFRNTCNELYFNKDDINFGYASYYCIGSCINSMVRFGPNGFNQSYGNRNLSKKFNQISYNNLHISYNNIEIHNNDYKELLDDSKNILYFIDPPYELMHSTYDSNFDKLRKTEFLNIITKQLINSKIIYTDVYTLDEWKLLKSFGWKRHYLRNMKSIKPGKINNNNEIIEVMYTNF